MKWWNDEAIDIVDVDDVSVIDDSVNDQEENANNTCMNLSQADISSIGEQFKCEKCDYESATRFSLNTHKQSGHNWCYSCYSNFNSQEQLKDHMKNIYIEKRKNSRHRSSDQRKNS